MPFTELFVETPGQTNLYAFPASASYALSTWATHRVLALEVQTGLYSATCDDAKSTKWLVFVGATQPANMNEAIYELTKPVSIPALAGARTVTITVQLASVNVEGATVRVSKASESDAKVTDSNGQVTFNLDDGTWTVAITASGATFAGASLVVNGDETATYALTSVSLSASDAGKRTVYYTCYGNNGALLVGTTVYAKCVKAPGSGLALMGTDRAATSDGSGIVSFTNCIVGATYEFSMGTGKKIVATIPAGSSAIALETIVGK